MEVKVRLVQVSILSNMLKKDNLTFEQLAEAAKALAETNKTIEQAFDAMADEEIEESIAPSVRSKPLDFANIETEQPVVETERPVETSEQPETEQPDPLSDYKESVDEEDSLPVSFTPGPEDGAGTSQPH